MIVNQLRASAALPSLRASGGVNAETVAVAQKASDLITSSRPQKALGTSGARVEESIAIRACLR